MVSCRSHPALGGTVGSEMAKSRTGLEAGAQKFTYRLKSHSVRAGDGKDTPDPRPRLCDRRASHTSMSATRDQTRTESHFHLLENPGSLRTVVGFHLPAKLGSREQPGMT